MTHKHLIKVARLELEEWKSNPYFTRGAVMAILFAFMHRATTGETVEETFFRPKDPQLDYQI